MSWVVVIIRPRVATTSHKKLNQLILLNHFIGKPRMSMQTAIFSDENLIILKPPHDIGFIILFTKIHQFNKECLFHCVEQGHIPQLGCILSSISYHSTFTIYSPWVKEPTSRSSFLILTNIPLDLPLDGIHIPQSQFL